MRIPGLLALCLSLYTSLATPLDSGARGQAPTLLVMGDSLSAAYGIALDSGWVRLLQERLEAKGYPHRVVNGSISGETTAGGLARLPSMLEQHTPRIVLIELGGNDGLRGLPIAQLRANLEGMARLSRESGAGLVVFEMRIPTNYGPAYAQQFRQAFADVAGAHGAKLVPFFLEKVEAEGLFQDDGIHPTAAAQPMMLDAAWPAVEAALKATTATARK